MLKPKGRFKKMILKILALTFLSILTANAGVIGKKVTYNSDSLTMKGYLAFDDGMKGKRPGIIVVHEWWGNNDYSRRRADMLAELGYIALAVDMYGDGKQADNPTDAGKFAREVMKDPSTLQARFTAAMDFLKNDEHVDASQIGAIGYCFGGGVVLAMARIGIDLKAVVCFHGSLATQNPAKKGDIKARILVCNGAADKFISADDVKKFKVEMKSAGVDFKFIDYPGATHAFTNPASTEVGKKFNMPIAYNEKADKRSWSEMQKWFKKTFGK
jgi:dienelactone hydrolase